MYRTVKFVFVATLMAVPAAAQVREVPVELPAVVEQQAPARTPAPPTPAVAPQSGQRTPSAAAPAAPAEAPRMPDPGIDRTDANIKLAVKLTDTGALASAGKITTLSLANMSSGRIRSTGGRNSWQLSIDASAELRKSGLVKVSLTISYVPQSDDPGPQLENVTESITVFLKDGIPTVVSQAADPTKGSRSVSIEVTASVVK